MAPAPGGKSVSVRHVKTSCEHFGFDDIDERLWILLEDAFGNDLRFCAGNDAVQHLSLIHIWIPEIAVYASSTSS